MREPTAWRLIEHPPSNGAWNMAVDEALLQSVASGEALPTLRLYSWEPACLSLGHAQPYTDTDLQRLEAHGWELVRRPTGGRAILHQHELTYAIIAPEEHPLMVGGVLESYHRISRGLVSALDNLAISVEVRNSKPLAESARTNPVCFEVPSAYEITIEGRKVLGSAQVRRHRTVLQHGSLPLTGNISSICDVLHFSEEAHRDRARINVRGRAATLEEILGYAIPWDRAAQAFILGFTEALGLTFESSDLSPVEMSAAQELLEQRYHQREWTQRIGN